ncbi:hypothetical protein J4226_05080 [Candidatus Pacearchaeota archaeon]|nr:hypothetical protein [Candidatus Pacearchaeota archaeon]
MKRIFFLIILFFSFSFISASEESLWAESNSVSVGMDSLTNSANANGPTTGNYAVAADTKWAGDNQVWTFVINNSVVSTGVINSVFIYLKHYQSGHIDDGLNLEIYNGTSWQIIQSYDGTVPPTSDTTSSWNVSSILNSWTKLNASQFRIIGVARNTGNDPISWYIDTVELRINYTDTIPPASVTNLQNQSRSYNWIYWNWTNPFSDFSEAIVYLNGIWKINTSNNYYNATGLTQNTDYTITVHTKDSSGNVNDTDVNSTASTEVFSDSCTYSGSGNWNVDCSHNCVISSNVDLLGNSISIVGTGTFSTTANITNFSDLLIAGADSINRCEVYCLEGGCFK